MTDELPAGLPEVRAVNERWILRNGSVAVIVKRCGSYASGKVEGSDQVLVWEHGVGTKAGSDFDFMRMEDGSGGEK